MFRNPEMYFRNAAICSDMAMEFEDIRDMKALIIPNGQPLEI